MDTKRTITIVEGPTIYREGLITVLTRLGYHVAIIADHGDHYIAASRQCAVDLVVVNVGPYLRMAGPSMEGLATLAWIKQQRPPLPVLALSDRPDAALAYRAFRAGARAFEHRDLDPALLARMLKTLLCGDYFGNRYKDDYHDGVHKAPQEHRPTNAERLALLTPKQKLVFDYVLRYPHISRPCMAGRLKMKPDTLKTHLSNIFSALGVGSMACLIHWAARNGLVAVDNPVPTTCL